MKSLFIVLILFTLFACDENIEATIPLVVYDANDDYMQEFARQIDLAGQDNFTVELFDSQNSQVIQNEIIEAIFDEAPPLIIINMVDRVGAYSIIEKAKLRDIPLIFINREPLQSDLNRYEKAYYIGADAHQSAEMQADLIMEHFHDLAPGERVKSAILMGQQGHQDAEIRTRHVIDTLEARDFPIDLLDIRVANFSQHQAYEETLKLFDDYGDDIELIISNNDAMAIGAIEAMIELDRMPPLNIEAPIDIENDPWIPIVGVDALPASHEYLKSNHYYGTVLQDTVTMAHAVSQLASMLMNEASLESYEYPIENNHYIWIDYQPFNMKNE